MLIHSYFYLDLILLMEFNKYKQFYYKYLENINKCHGLIWTCLKSNISTTLVIIIFVSEINAYFAIVRSNLR